MFDEYKNCRLCPRECGVDRTKTRGACGMPDTLYLSRAALHHWEEPCISGVRGSGTVFFSGCSLKCVFCQNREISRGISGKAVTPERLTDIFFSLADSGAHNINLVTPTHYLPHIVEALQKAKERGLSLPIVYNTSGYEKPEMLNELRGLVDVFLPDFKYYSSRLSKAYASAPDYFERAKAAVSAMVNMTGKPQFGKDGMMTKGTVVRILLLPGALLDAKAILHHLHTVYGNDIYISLMRQYTPPPDMVPPLNRRVTDAEYHSFVSYAASLGIENAYTQDAESVSESFIPPFDLTGV